jgi:hypothetical protein
MENWLSHRGRGELAACDAGILRSSFEKVIQQSGLVETLTTDLLHACFPNLNSDTQHKDTTQ